MSKPQLKDSNEGSINISVELLPTGHKRRMFFNRFHLVHIEGQLLVYFGLVDETHVLRDVYACMFTKQTLENSKENLTAFLAKVGAPTTTPQPWVPPAGVIETDMANVISVGQSLEAELLLSSFAVGPSIARSKKEAGPIPTDSLALLRCDPKVIKLLIAEIYVNL